MLSPAEETDNPTEMQQARSSSRERNLTEKGQEMHEQTTKKNEKTFNKAYDSWKGQAKEIRTKLKTLCSAEDLQTKLKDIKAQEASVHQHYEPFRRCHAATPVIVNRMDACVDLTAEICDLINKRLEEIDKTFNNQLEKERVRMRLSKKDHGSIFGNTETETILSESSQDSDSSSRATSRSSSKRAEAEADLAAKVEQAKAMQQIREQQARLSKLESELKLKEAQMQAEMKLKLEEEKTKLQQLQAENEVKVAAARVRVYNAYDGIENNDLEMNHQVQGLYLNSDNQPSLNPQAAPFRPPNVPNEVSRHQETASLTPALASLLISNRLPAPEPTVFTGDPLKFIDWKISFMALIDQKLLPVCEKMLYLKSYLGGEARKAVEGFFYRNSEDAYQGAWEILQERYGGSFVVQRAFREKLMKWPKISTNDSIALREFADFLQGCVEAIPHVKGLAILNDCEENHKLLKKLPEWVVRRWSRIVVDELDRSQEYPSFACFTDFLQKEARIACNPIASPLMLNTKPTDEKFPKRAKVFNTSTQMKPSAPSTAKTPALGPRPPCLVCKDKTHGVVKCPTFAGKSVDEKKAFIHENHLCFGCLRKGHTTKNCRGRHTCSICSRRHPTCLHIQRNAEPVKTPSADSEASGNKADSEIPRVMSHTLTRHTSATSCIVPVLLSAAAEPQGEILTYALLDTQSDSTFILADLVSQLNVNTQPLQLKLSTMAAVDTVIASEVARGLQVRGFSSGTQIQLCQAYTRDFIPVDKSHIPTKETALQWPHLKQLANKLQPLQDCEVGLLIGYDCPSALAPLEVITGSENEPFAQRTVLGWSIIGSVNPYLDRQGSQSFVHRVTVKEMPLPPVTDVLRALERDFNERNYEDKYVSQDDVHFVQFLSETIMKRPDGHYEMPLPFKDNNPPALPNNKKLASIRLQHLKKKLKANKEYHEHYTTFMEETIRRGDAEPVPPSSEQETVWYIPHHGVYHPNKPTKLRVVFDCSAKFHGISLNDTLLTGPDLINSLVGVLCRFRKEAVAVICDIEKMFHQFYIPPVMRDYLRFLWWENGQLDTEPKEYRMAVHLFGASSSPGCANFGLKYLARQHREEYPSASSFIENNFYVDDGLISLSTVKDATDLVVEAQELCKTAGLRLHKFNSNKGEVLSCIAPSERAVTREPLKLHPDSSPDGQVIGIQWSVENDTFSFSVRIRDQPPTRRGILSVVSSLYDPLGFVAPFVLSGKSILQELCRRGIGWDDALPESLSPQWEIWKSGLPTLKEIKIPRCYHPPNFGNIVRVELHHFSDASNRGYGACSYLKYKNERGEVHCCLVMAKARVAPTKLMSIPRLELSAAVTAAKLSVMLKAELEMRIDGEFFWTDSQVVLAYISNEARRFHVFVANRVQLIRETTDPAQWHYVDTAQNPADHASRGLQATDISSSSWLSGPSFLWESEVPSFPSSSTELLVGDPEVRPLATHATQVSDQGDVLSHLNRFSSWSLLVRVIARIKRLGSNTHFSSDLVTAEERKRAAEIVTGLVQHQAFPHELKLLQKGDTLPSSSPLSHLDPILVQGLIRVGGRLSRSTLSQEIKHPVVLPKDGHIIQLILSHYHAATCHQGRNQTLNELRANGFWVLGGSKAVARLIHKCVLCRKLRRPTEEQRMSELPEERVEASAPFLHCGMDCFGPFVTKQGRKEHKRYGLIFTCLYLRAVHIEMLEDLSTDAFINGLRCFISLRGAVCRLRCDQGTNFTGAKNELKEALKQCNTKALEAFLANKQCELTFNAPSASHAGGVWERQIRTIRNVLNATTAQCSSRLDDASLRTLFYEAMAIVNSRPLTVDGINDPKAPEPLTPNHLILMKSKVALPPPGKFVKEDMYGAKRWRRVQYLAEQFWSRWKREYLMSLSMRQKWHTPRRNLKVNDIVIIKEEVLPRGQWQLGRVVDTTEGKDGFVRRVKVQVGDRKHTKKRDHASRPSIIERPIQKLVVLIESK
ncbi:uncharacterized protein LOC121642470 [Melanotaenia boesemani]|uniref:uncharacterized protein LOC121642470 n=1 Tax=Melanotaenia boesemani TaxID=1250792 RepID=UPI001C044D28|nr:uncharacterized protein LOC121642470 [Melanotaenia boesemani]